MEIGQHNGFKTLPYVQPVIPSMLILKLNHFSRWVLPVVSQYNILAQGTSKFGLGVAVIRGFVSLSQSKLTSGVGPAIFGG